MNSLPKVIFILSLMATGCALRERNSTDVVRSSIKNKITIESKIIKDKCKNNNIQKYLDEGWEIESSERKEIPCTWKKVKAKRNCKPNIDKGCLITIPDTYGELMIYNLKREL